MRPAGTAGAFSFGNPDIDGDMLRKLCVAPGCDDLAIAGLAHCPEHEEERRSRRAEAKAKAARRVFDDKGRDLRQSRAWRRFARLWLKRNPMCVHCAEVGLDVVATEVDHIERHLGDRKKFWDAGNLQSLCKSCHSRKTAKEVWHGQQ